MPHIEGGFFRRTYSAGSSAVVPVGGDPRIAASSIYYMLTADSPIGHWHKNRSDILHFYHAGSPISYWLISPTRVLSQQILGPNVAAGECFQWLVPGGYWKAAILEQGDYGLLSEVVVPGFEFADMALASEQDLQPLLSEADWQKAKDWIKGV